MLLLLLVSHLLVRRRCGLPVRLPVVWLQVLLLQGCLVVVRSVLVGRRLLRRMLRLFRGWVPRSVDQVRVVVKAPVAGSPVVPVGDCRVGRPVVVVLLVAAGSPTAAELVQRPVLVVRCRVRVACPRLPVNRPAPEEVPVQVGMPVASVVLFHRPRVEMPPVRAAPLALVVTVVLPPARRPGAGPVRSATQPVVALQV